MRNSYNVCKSRIKYLIKLIINYEMKNLTKYVYNFQFNISWHFMPQQGMKIISLILSYASCITKQSNLLY